MNILSAFLFVIWTACSIWAGHIAATSLKVTPEVVCWEMPQADLKGWKRVPEVDAKHLAFMVSKGKVVMREEPSLMCREYAERTTPLQFIAKEYWYKVKS